MAASILSFARRKAALACDAHLRGALTILALALPTVAPARAEHAPVTAVASHIENAQDHTRLVFDLTSSVAAHVWPIANPARIIVDLPEVSFQMDPSANRGAGSKLIRAYRFGQFAPGRSRVVIDLAAPASAVRVESQPAPSGARLIVELAPTSAARFTADAQAAGAIPATKASTPPPAPIGLAPLAPTEKPVVMIDPGHGGVDQGAVARNGTEEKMIVLAFARALRDKIEAGGRLHAVLTRDDDIFLPLAERVALAHRANAALFLSIHADTLAAPHVEGATVYTVSAAASDAEAARTAEHENNADQAAGLETPAAEGEIGDILFDLTRRETHAFSRQFSHSLVTRWKEAGSLNKNPTRSAGFVVLKAHDIPSALLELGYVSSARDLARLTSPDWRDRAAGKTAEAIETFFAARAPAAVVAAPVAPRPE